MSQSVKMKSKAASRAAIVQAASMLDKTVLSNTDNQVVVEIEKGNWGKAQFDRQTNGLYEATYDNMRAKQMTQFMNAVNIAEATAKMSSIGYRMVTNTNAAAIKQQIMENRTIELAFTR